MAMESIKVRCHLFQLPAVCLLGVGGFTAAGYPIFGAVEEGLTAIIRTGLDNAAYILTNQGKAEAIGYLVQFGSTYGVQALVVMNVVINNAIASGNAPPDDLYLLSDLGTLVRFAIQNFPLQ